MTTEHAECVVFAQWLRLNNVFFLHVANEGQRSFGARKNLQKEGLMPGAPDYLIFTRPVGKSFRGIAVEMKRPKSYHSAAGRPTPAQMAFLKRLDECGWLSAVCYGADDAIEFCKRNGIGR